MNGASRASDDGAGLDGAVARAPTLLDVDALEAMSPSVFAAQTPYPWWAGAALRPEAWRELEQRMPDLAQFDEVFGKPRRFGQQPHDRYALDYRSDLPVHPIWHRLVEELSGSRYGDWVAARLGTTRFRLRLHWHYTPAGRSVSPHCDARRKLGSHIFYFNDPDRWDPAWGGETCILDDEGCIDRRSNPGFEDFASCEAPSAVGNQSLLFARRGGSWHGVRALRCPEGELRRVFIVVFEATSRWPWAR